MEHLSFVLWIIGWSLMWSIVDSLDVKEKIALGKPQREMPTWLRMFIIMVWVIVSIAIF